MRFALCATLGVVLLGLFGGPAGAVDCAGTITADEALKAEDARYAAQTSGDFAALEKLFGDDLVYVHSSGRVDNKASYIEVQKSKSIVYRAMRRSNVAVRIYGCIAIISGTGNFDVTGNGKDSSVELLFQSIWAKREAGVQFVSWESTPAPKQ
ncbi:MAG: nuclear transport factor 2 family protein [Methylobacteriaceae bacterium]|nr:nuclear transport factor 2 family protein [Methylobacteriaceae bacterium]MBV9635116.1 nuclear transport factor 2 family protein [Methylobacteriaceae bacterium]MBV9703599.1 nuclear transport factor 2 family protein [Methylobacteriaceae bacterium]